MTFDAKSKVMDMRGKEYLEVKWRIVWFRDEHPKGTIRTEVVNFDPLVIRADIFNGDGQALATGHGSAQAKAGAVWSGREIEKAETAAIGRALAHAGYGTQFTGDDEEGHLADSPTEKAPEKAQPSKSKPRTWTPETVAYVMESDLVNCTVEKHAVNLLNLSGLVDPKTEQLQEWLVIYAKHRHDMEAKDAARNANIELNLKEMGY